MATTSVVVTRLDDALRLWKAGLLRMCVFGVMDGPFDTKWFAPTELEIARGYLYYYVEDDTDG